MFPAYRKVHFREMSAWSMFFLAKLFPAYCFSVYLAVKKDDNPEIKIILGLNVWKSKRVVSPLTIIEAPA